MEKTYIKEMRQLLETSYNYLKDDTSNGCYHLPLEDELFLVVSYNSDENSVLAKIAYNCSSLQSDYNYDWAMPEFKDNNCCFVEVALDGRTFRKTAEYMYAETKAIIRYRKNGSVIDWRKNK